MKNLKRSISKMKLIVITLQLFISVVNLNAQNTFLSKEYNSVLWEISGNGLEKPSYLFGTIHIIPEADYIFNTISQEKFNNCEILVLEADIDLSIKQQIELVKKMMLPKGKPLNKYMTTEQFNEFKSYMIDTLKLKKSKFEKLLKLKPIISSEIMLVELLGKTKTYEVELNKNAKDRKMQLKYLETLDFQVSILDKITVEDQVKMIFGSKKNSSILSEYNNLLSAYKEGDLDKLNNLSTSDTSFVQFEKEMLTDRNEDWIPKIEEIIQSQTSFIAVGAAHLPGDLGVINLLRKQGYTVKPIK